MDVLDENEALQQFFEGKSPLGAMVSSPSLVLAHFHSLLLRVHLCLALERMLSDNSGVGKDRLYLLR